MSFVAIATAALVVSASILNAVAVLLTLEGMDQRSGNGRIGSVLLVLGITLLLGFDFVVYPLVALSSQGLGGLTLLWLAFLPLGLIMIGIGANLRRTGVLLKRRRR